jgi:hypothetical protein
MERDLTRKSRRLEGRGQLSRAPRVWQGMAVDGQPAGKRTQNPLLASWVVLTAALGLFVPLAAIPIAIYGVVMARRAGARDYVLAYGAVAVLSTVYLCAVVFIAVTSL